MLPYQQAVRWLGGKAGVGVDGATLAELYALQAGVEPVTTADVAPQVGQYL